MSVHPSTQGPLLQAGVPREQRIDRPIPDEVITRLSALPEFVKAYEYEGMPPEGFIAYGVTQRTLGQFVESGWRLLENFRID